MMSRDTGQKALQRVPKDMLLLSGVALGLDVGTGGG